MSGIKEEFLVFITALVTGGVLRTAYLCVDCLREIIPHRPKITAAEDILYWIGSALYVFVQIYHTSDGSVRWYFILGVVIGAVFVSMIIRKIKKIYKKIYANRKKDLS